WVARTGAGGVADGGRAGGGRWIPGHLSLARPSAARGAERAVVARTQSSPARSVAGLPVVRCDVDYCSSQLRPLHVMRPRTAATRTRHFFMLRSSQKHFGQGTNVSHGASRVNRLTLTDISRPTTLGLPRMSPEHQNFYPRVFALATAAVLGIALFRILRPFVGPLLWSVLLAFLL